MRKLYTVMLVDSLCIAHIRLIIVLSKLAWTGKWTSSSLRASYGCFGIYPTVPMGYHMISLVERQKTTYLTVGTRLEVSSETPTHQLLSCSFYDYSSHIQRVVEGVAKQELWALPVL